eukprot:342369-Chlamydomonas_euryale.AAC.1
MQIWNVPHPDDGGKPPALQRTFKPPPEVLMLRFLEWVQRWHNQGYDARSGHHMFTLESTKLFKRIMRGIQLWFLSDPWMFDSDGTVKVGD